jgi:hypothetical protein
MLFLFNTHHDEVANHCLDKITCRFGNVFGICESAQVGGWATGLIAVINERVEEPRDINGEVLKKRDVVNILFPHYGADYLLRM